MVTGQVLAQQQLGWEVVGMVRGWAKVEVKGWEMVVVKGLVMVEVMGWGRVVGRGLG
jgi:hypothetical protein